MIFIITIKNINFAIQNKIENGKPLKGEITIVIAGYVENIEINLEELRTKIKDKLKKYSVKDIVKILNSEIGLSKKIIYNETIILKNKIDKS